ncbi:MAG TPA: sigma-70 family RNA polymerase sigma factor [Kofleriaceae bacterium]|nr:sigma-70 family RNA polymerase sigma factor [Kofleriaceae bacterium]
MGSIGSRIEESTPIDFDAALGNVLDAAQRSFPTFCLSPDVFVAYLRERLPPDLPPPIALRRMHTSDLYLACACAHGDPDAIAVLDERYLGQLDRALSRIGIDRDTVADVKQEIRYRVLVGDGGHAEIVDFAGRGDLRGWVRVMATRRALQHQSRARREQATEDDELWQHLVAVEPHMFEHAKELYRREFKLAFETALRALPHREKTVLRQHYLDGATLDELALLYRVHRATVTRILGRAREMVLASTRDRLMSELDVPLQELDSILRMIWSRIEFSLRAIRRGRKATVR